MSAEAAIYPTSNSVSNRFFQNHPTFPTPPQINPEQNQKRPSKEEHHHQSRTFSEEKLQNQPRHPSEFLRTLQNTSKERGFYSNQHPLSTDCFSPLRLGIARKKRQKEIHGLPRLPAWIFTESIGARNLAKEPIKGKRPKPSPRGRDHVSERGGV